MRYILRNTVCPQKNYSVVYTVRKALVYDTPIERPQGVCGRFKGHYIFIYQPHSGHFSLSLVTSGPCPLECSATFAH